MGRAAHSYREDPAVPAFPDDRPLVLFDGDCALCSASARLILKHDRAALFRLAPTRSPLGGALLAHYDVSPDDPSTMLLIESGRAYFRSEAALRIAARLPTFAWAGLARAAPLRMRDRLYDWVARRRRRLPGPTWCAMPHTGLDLSDRVIG